MNEAKTIFENIRSLRQLLTEGVGEDVIVDAIDNHEYIYLYYNGDDNVEKGYRTVRPMAMGPANFKNDSGTVLRAWQDKGRSQSLGPHAKRPHRKPYPHDEHELWTDTDGKDKPGWRLFKLDKISRVYPTGEKFHDDEGNVLIPPKYKEGTDSQMSTVTHWVKTSPARVDVDNVGDMDAPKVVSKPAHGPAVPVKRWEPFYRADVSKRPMDAQTIQKLYDIAMNVRKERTGDLFVAVDDKNKYHLRPEKHRERFPKNAIVGNLKQLYNDLVLNNRTKSSSEQDFANKELEKFNQSIAGGEKNNA